MFWNFLFSKKKRFYLLIYLREWEGTEREGESLKQTLPWVQSSNEAPSHDSEIMTWAQIKSQTINWATHMPLLFFKQAPRSVLTLMTPRLRPELKQRVRCLTDRTTEAATKFPSWFLLLSLGYLEVLCWISKYLENSCFLLLMIFLTPLWSENIFWIISVIFNLFSFVLGPIIWFI